MQYLFEIEDHNNLENQFVERKVWKLQIKQLKQQILNNSEGEILISVLGEILKNPHNQQREVFGIFNTDLLSVDLNMLSLFTHIGKVNIL